MRIIAGKFKSRVIKPPKGAGLRPTSARVKESLFGILGGFVIDKEVLDLFSGTGNLGLEALSRGARSCVFVDNNPRCTTAIAKNLEVLGAQKEAQVLLKDTFKFIKEAHRANSVFDVVFIDPPYYTDMIKKCLILLDNYNIINPSGFVIAEHHTEDDLPQSTELRHLGLCRQQRYGGTILSFYKRR